VQEKAFEMLLSQELGGTAKPATAKLEEEDAGKDNEGGAEAAIQKRGGEDLLTGDLHLKARKFLDKQGLSVDDLNELFYKEAGVIKPLFEDLKTTRASESQIRLSLLAALQNAIP